jgi:hypothetical protein
MEAADLSPLELARLQWKQKTIQQPPQQPPTRSQQSNAANSQEKAEPKVPTDRSANNTNLSQSFSLLDKNYYAPNPHLLTHLTEGIHSQAYSVLFGTPSLLGSLFYVLLMLIS